MEEKLLNASILKVHEHNASPRAKQTLVVKVYHESLSVQEVHFERDPSEAVWRCLPEPWITDNTTGERRRLTCVGILTNLAHCLSSVTFCLKKILLLCALRNCTWSFERNRWKPYKMCKTSWEAWCTSPVAIVACAFRRSIRNTPSA